MNLNQLKESFEQLGNNLNNFNELLLLQKENTSLYYPGLPEILLNNKYYESLNSYLDFLNKNEKSYLIINFFQNNLLKIDNHSTLKYAESYIDNLLSISLDKLKFDEFFKINDLFPNQIKEQSIIKLIKIYETNQKHFFDFPMYEKCENLIIENITQLNDLGVLKSNINEFIPLIPLYIKIAQKSEQIIFLNNLDNIFKEHFPSYMENFIDKMILEKKLEISLSNKDNKILKLKI